MQDIFLQSALGSRGHIYLIFSLFFFHPVVSQSHSCVPSPLHYIPFSFMCTKPTALCPILIHVFQAHCVPFSFICIRPCVPVSFYDSRIQSPPCPILIHLYQALCPSLIHVHTRPTVSQFHLCLPGPSSFMFTKPSVSVSLMCSRPIVSQSYSCVLKLVLPGLLYPSLICAAWLPR